MVPYRWMRGISCLLALLALPGPEIRKKVCSWPAPFRTRRVPARSWPYASVALAYLRKPPYLREILRPSSAASARGAFSSPFLLPDVQRGIVLRARVLLERVWAGLPGFTAEDWARLPTGGGAQ